MRKGEGGKSSNRLMSMEMFQHILEQVKATAHTMQFYFQGEPLLNPQLPEMIALARQAGLYTIVSTNAQALSQEMAHLLIQSGLNRIIVSIDGFSQESYEAYRAEGNLQKALDVFEKTMRGRISIARYSSQLVPEVSNGFSKLMLKMLVLDATHRSYPAMESVLIGQKSLKTIAHLIQKREYSEALSRC
jgi:molybdenum cofactor biosynthesis enzyme MoaA